MVELSTKNAEKEGVSDRATFVKADIFESDFSKATVITLFLMTDLNVRLRPKLLELKPGTRIVSNTFTMQEWEADQTENIEGDCYSWCTALLWYVPAKVKGTWKFQEGELALEQNFQMVSGKLKTNNRSYELSEGRLKGDELTFKANGSQYTGKVNGKNITGTYSNGSNMVKWNAVRTGG